ncbi:MAG TPA: beta-galactosidase [Candidatus Hydrogenedentes bacterium]|jgi:hypothetical protein|nr:MAG: hypothetical protein BWY07_00361 [Candidatus Hydrogenedentes bacterium ADurb.Bin170]HPX85443.1 beta-galactosidase [Candidatus Hydrogenedentota bacterium]HQB03878.1 beta-galactosidase [Candidatus Hydrogenedentota bacterium]
MPTARSLRFAILPLLFLSGVLCASALPATADTAASLEEIWFDSWTVEKSNTVTIDLPVLPSVPAADNIDLGISIAATVPYQKTAVILQVRDVQNNLAQRLESIADLRQGLNDFRFEWSGLSLTPGRYTLSIQVDYSDAFPPLSAHTCMRRISSEAWQQKLAQSIETLSKLEQQSTALSEGIAKKQRQAQVTAPYLNLGVQTAHRAIEAAKDALQQSNWSVVSRNMEYLETALPSLQAALVFSTQRPELCMTETTDHLTCELRQGGFYCSDKALFLFGLGLPNPETTTEEQAFLENQAALLSRYNLNFLVLNCPITLDKSQIASLLDRAASAAEHEQLFWALQFQQDEDVEKLMDVQPAIINPGFVNLAHVDFNKAYRDQLLAAMPHLQNRSGRIAAVSLADNPRFHYDGEEVRQAFINTIKEKHPDRMTLNRLWHAKLASYDEISIWENPKEHSYHNQRAYQYEWQTFHRSLIADFFSQFKQSLSSLAPKIPLTLTQPDTAFLPGETRSTAGRSDMSEIMDLQACTVRFEPGDGVYALNYPIPNAYLTLMRSYQPDKALLPLKGDIDVSTIKESEMRVRIVTAALWESVISGASGFVLAHDSSVFDYPDAFEAFVRSTMDINRLGNIVVAFQQDTPEIGILFSEAAKIMDDGVPHLESARFAFEGSSFSGYPIHYLTEGQILKGGLDKLKVLIMPETMAISDEAFLKIDAYVEAGGMVARVGTPIPYNESGISRNDVIRTSPNTVLVRGMNLPTEYLHAMDAVLDRGKLPLIPRPINAHGYPLEGVRSRYVRIQNQEYLYIINLRRAPVGVHITGASEGGRDLILARDVEFPREMEPLEVMLVQLDSPAPADLSVQE